MARGGRIVGIDYAAIAATALRLIDANGVPATLRVYGAPAYDPLTDVETRPYTDYPVFVVLSRLNEGVDTFDIQMVRDSYVIGNATKAFVAGAALPAGVSPAPNDLLIFAAGDTWTIRGNNPIRPANSPLVHILVCVR
jgi:hypothetical protein